MKRLFFCSLIAFLAAVALADTAAAQGISKSPQSQADETIDLNIAERRITESNYRAATEVEIAPQSARGVWLRVGVGVIASNIDALLRNVAGRVRFRASLDTVLNRINRRRSN